MPLQSNNLKKTPASKDRNNAAGPFSNLFGSGEVNQKDIMYFTLQLAMLLENHSTLVESLEILSENITKPKLREMIINITDEVKKGELFSTALTKYKQHFSNTYINLVASSEDGGFLHEVLAEMNRIQENADNMQSVIMSALSYPMVLMFFSFAVVLFVLMYVFPKFTGIFETINIELPATTYLLIAMSKILLKYWHFLLIGVMSSLVALRYSMTTKKGKEYIDSLKLTVPILRDVYIKIYIIRAFDVMSLSIAKHVSIMDTLNSTREIIDNRIFQKFIYDCINTLKQGGTLSDAFNNSKIIPPLAKQMINTGEKTGHLSDVMSKIAVYYEKELMKILNTIAKALEPIMLIVMGVIVGVIVASLILPIFKISSGIH